MVNIILTVGGISLIVPVISFLLILFNQWNKLDPLNFRLVILNIRCIIFLPVISILTYISMCWNESFPFISFLVTPLEAYPFLSFLALVVTNFGGPSSTIYSISNDYHNYKPKLILFRDINSLYTHTAHFLVRSLTFRSALVFIGMIFYYSYPKAGIYIYSINLSLSTMILFYTMFLLTSFYNYLIHKCGNIMGLSKIVQLILSIGIITLEKTIQAIVFISQPGISTDDYQSSGLMNLQGDYGFLALMELLVFGLIFLVTFSLPISSNKMYFGHSTPLKLQDLNSRISFIGYVKEIFKLLDVFDDLKLKIEDESYDEDNIEINRSESAVTNSQL